MFASLALCVDQESVGRSNGTSDWASTGCEWNLFFSLITRSVHTFDLRIVWVDCVIWISYIYISASWVRLRYHAWNWMLAQRVIQSPAASPCSCFNGCVEHTPLTTFIDFFSVLRCQGDHLNNQEDRPSQSAGKCSCWGSATWKCNIWDSKEKKNNKKHTLADGFHCFLPETKWDMVRRRMRKGSSFISRVRRSESDAAQTQLFGQPLSKICPADGSLPKPVIVSRLLSLSFSLSLVFCFRFDAISSLLCKKWSAGTLMVFLLNEGDSPATLLRLKIWVTLIVAGPSPPSVVITTSK